MEGKQGHCYTLRLLFQGSALIQCDLDKKSGWERANARGYRHLRGPRVDDQQSSLPCNGLLRGDDAVVNSLPDVDAIQGSPT